MLENVMLLSPAFVHFFQLLYTIPFLLKFVILINGVYYFVEQLTTMSWLDAWFALSNFFDIINMLTKSVR